jgi:ribose transport system substrate-binding protein
MPRRSKLLWFVLAALCLALVVAACGGGGSSSSSTSGGETEEAAETEETSEETSEEESSGSSSAVVEEAEKEVEEAKKPVTEFNGPAKSPPPAKGKTVYVISCSPDTEGCQRDVSGALEAVEEMGWTAKRLDTKGAPEEFVASMEQAMNAGADGIIAASFPLEAIAQPLKEAESKGIPVVTMIAGNENSEAGANFKGGYFAEIGADGTEQGRQAADWIISQTKGKATIGILNTPEFPILGARIEGFKEKFEECPECSIKQEVNVPLVKLASEATSATANFLQANPDVNFLFPTYDGMALFAAPAIKSVGDEGKVYMVAIDGNKPNLAAIEKEESQSASVVAPHEWIGWAAVDEINRAFAGEPVAPEWQPGGGGIPSKLLDKTNLPPAGEDFTGDIEYKKEFRKLWGIE